MILYRSIIKQLSSGKLQAKFCDSCHVQLAYARRQDGSGYSHPMEYWWCCPVTSDWQETTRILDKLEIDNYYSEKTDYQEMKKIGEKLQADIAKYMAAFDKQIKKGNT